MHPAAGRNILNACECKTRKIVSRQPVATQHTVTKGLWQQRECQCHWKSIIWIAINRKTPVGENSRERRSGYPLIIRIVHFRLTWTPRACGCQKRNTCHITCQNRLVSARRTAGDAAADRASAEKGRPAFRQCAARERDALRVPRAACIHIRVFGAGEKVSSKSKIGEFRELDPGPPAPEAGIIPLDQIPHEYMPITPLCLPECYDFLSFSFPPSPYPPA